MRSFSKIIEDLESWERELSKFSRIFEKLLMVAENGSFAVATIEIKIQCPHNLPLSFEKVFLKTVPVRLRAIS